MSSSSQDNEADDKEDVILDLNQPQEWKEIEEEDTKAGLEVYRQMGPLALLIYRRII